MSNFKQLALVAFGLLLGVHASAATAVFRDPLDVPAQVMIKAARSVLVGVTHAPGGRWMAVGRRGHILYSDDGSSWNQALVPVSVDLVAVHFPTKQQGWAVGHGGVILHSADG